MAIFGGPLTANQPSVSGANSVAGLLFDSPGWTLNSAWRTLTIGTGGVVVEAASGTVTLNKAVTVLAGTRTWKNKTGSTPVMASMGGPTATPPCNGGSFRPGLWRNLETDIQRERREHLLRLSSGILQAHKSGWINNRDLTVNGGTFLVTSSNGDLIRGGYSVILNGGQINWGGFNEAFGTLSIAGGAMRGSNSTISIEDAGAAKVNITGNATLGYAADAGSSRSPAPAPPASAT